MTLSLPSLDAPSRRVTLRADAGLYVPRLLESHGFAGYEPDALACFLAAIGAAQAGSVLDIGANVGVYSLLARAVTDREVIAFEPTPQLATVARETGERNGLAYRVEECALGAEDGTATLFLSGQTDSSNSLAAGFRPSHESLDVTVRTLDALCEAGMTPPAVVKIDTETTEPDVLRGSRRTLASHRPWLLVEVLPGRTEKQLSEVLEPFDYHWYRIEPTVPYRRSDVLKGDPRQLMWLFAPEEPDAAFWAGVERWQRLLADCRPVR